MLTCAGRLWIDSHEETPSLSFTAGNWDTPQVILHQQSSLHCCRPHKVALCPQASVQQTGRQLAMQTVPAIYGAVSIQ